MSDEGQVIFVDVKAPSCSAEPSREYSWYIVGRVINAPVTNPGVCFFYLDGPSNITLVKNDGTTETLAPFRFSVVYKEGSQPVGTTIDSREVYRGVVFPALGSYILLLQVGQYFESGSESSSAEETASSLTMEGRKLTVKQTALGVRRIFIGHDFRLYCVCVQEKPWWEQELFGVPLWVPAAAGAFGAGLGIGMVVRK
jgi:hypothetical protein